MGDGRAQRLVHRWQRLVETRRQQGRTPASTAEHVERFERQGIATPYPKRDLSRKRSRRDPNRTTPATMHQLLLKADAGDLDAMLVLADALSEHGYRFLAGAVNKLVRKAGSTGAYRLDHWNSLRRRILEAITKLVPKRPTDTSLRRDFLRGVEDALWLPAWASAKEERRERTPRNITRKTADRMPPTVRTMARKFASTLIRLNDASLEEIYERASQADGGPVDAEELGYYLTMQALGHGVGWEDDHEPFEVRLPRAEAYAHRSATRWILDGYVS